MAQDTGNKALGGVIWSMAGAAGQTLFQLAVFMVLARTLTPEIFGVVAIATALIDLLNLIGRGGLVEVVVQREVADERVLNATFWASAVLGLAMTGFLFFSAGLLADIFSNEGLRDVILILSPTCLLFSIGAVYEAKLRRDYQFKALAARNVTATIVSGSVALVMALTGFGVFALVAQRLIFTLWSLVAMVAASKWLPRLELHWKEMGGQLRDGSSIAASVVLGAGNQRLIDLIVGYFLGATQLGYLRVAWRIFDLLNELAVRPFSNVTLTALSKARIGDGDLGTAYISTVKYGSIFIIPVFFGCSVVSGAIIALMFGPQWARSAELLSYLSLIGLFMPLIWFKSNVLIASGKFRHVFTLNAIEFLLSVIIVTIFAPFGLVSATIGNVVRTAIATPVILIYLERLLKISAWGTVKAIIPAAVASTIMAGAVILLSRYHGNSGPLIVWLLVDVGFGALVYAAVLLAMDRSLLKDLKSMRRKI